MQCALNDLYKNLIMYSNFVAIDVLYVIIYNHGLTPGTLSW